MDFDSLQSRAVTWHKERFPSADILNVGLKLSEESGEVNSAINALYSSSFGRGDVQDECADVLICLLVILGRWRHIVNSEETLIETVEKKLLDLETPGKHKSSIL